MKSINEILSGKEIDLNTDSIIFRNASNMTSIHFKDFDLLISHHDIQEPNRVNIMETIERYKKRYTRLLSTIQNETEIIFDHIKLFKYVTKIIHDIAFVYKFKKT